MSLSRRNFLLLVAALPLSGCGFHLRSNVHYAFKSIYIADGGAAELAEELRLTFRNMKSVQVVKDRKKADVILSITNLKSSKEILSLSSAGKAREYLLIETIDFTLRDNDDIEWMPAGEISVERTYLYDDSQRLAREIQEADIHDEIMRDMAQQILRRLQNAKKP